MIKIIPAQILPRKTKGTSLSDQKTGAVYEITMEGKEVSYKKQSTKKKKIVIPDQVTINGYTYKLSLIHI